MRMLALAALLIAACAPVLPPELRETPAVVVRFEGARMLRACTVHLGWSADVLIRECGDPALQMDWSGGGRCLIYETAAVTFSGGAGAPYHAVCLRESDYTYAPPRKTPGSQREASRLVTGEFVVAVFPIAGPPSASSVPTPAP